MKKFVYAFVLFCCAGLSTAQTRIIPQTGHGSNFCISLSHDDKMMVTADLDGRVMVWDIGRTKAMHNFKASEKGIYCAAWKKDGSLFAVCTADSILILYDAKTAKEIRRLKTPFTATHICFHPKESVLAIGGNDGNIKVLDYTSGTVYFSFKPDSFISGLEFSNNGVMLFAAGWNVGVLAYEMNQGKTMMTIPTVIEHFVAGMKLSPSNDFLFLYMQEGNTEVIDLATGKNTGSFQNNPYFSNANDVFYLEPVITGDNRFIISTNQDNNFVISDKKNNTSTIYHNSFSTHPVSTVLASHQSAFFIMADLNGAISVVYFDETAYANESPLLWRKLQLNPERIYRADFTNNDESLALTGTGYYQFNMVTGDMHRRDNDSAVVSNREYTTRYFITGENTDTYYYADLLRNTGYEINGDGSMPLYGIAFSKDTQVVAFINNNNDLQVYDLEKRKSLFKENGGAITLFNLFNGTINDYFVLQKKNELCFINKKGETIKKLILNEDKPVLNLCADGQTKNIYLINASHQLICYDFASGQKVDMKGELNKITEADLAEVSKDGKTLAVYTGKKIKFYGTAQGNMSFDLDVSNNLPYSYAFNQQGNRIAITHENGITEVWDISKKQKVFNVLASLQNGMVVYTDDHYYMANKGAARQLVFAEGNSLISLANAEINYNRPDKVLSTIGLANDRLLNAYKFAHERRLKQLKIKNGEHADLPEISLLNYRDLKASTTQKDQVLKIKAHGDKAKITAIKVWINDVPVFGKNGMSVQAKNDLEQSINIELSSGTNHIKCSAVNEFGMESEKEEISMINTNIVKPNLYLLTIGTSQYKNASFNLTYAAKDASDMAAMFKSMNKNDIEKPYNNIYTKTLTDAMVTKKEIAQAKDFLKDAGSNDIVMIFVAGHGVRDEQMQYFFGTHDMDFNKPAEKGFSEEEFAQLADGLKAIKRLVFFDTCLSGELDKDEAEQTLASATPVKDGNISFRTAGSGIRTKTSGLNNASALMREIYNDLDEGTGSTIISSAGGAEFAMESSEWKNGLFTYCFLNGLKNNAADMNDDKHISVSEIQSYVREQVIKLSKGKQQPSFKDENLVMDYRIW